jgi:diguanylate cyclase (GGDEF)-like protein
MRRQNLLEFFAGAGISASALLLCSALLDRLTHSAIETGPAWTAKLVAGVVLLLVAVALVRRRRSELDAAASSTQTALTSHATNTRVVEFDRLAAFGVSLASAQEVTAGRGELLRVVRQALGCANAWLIAREGRGWASVGTSPGQTKGPADVRREQAAEQFFRTGGGDAVRWTVIDEDCCLPLVAAGTPIGLLGVPCAEAATAEAQKALLAATAPLLAATIRNARLFTEVIDSSLRDDLTGCFTRPHTVDTLAAELSRAARSRKPVSVMMFDLDHFKLVNDRYGHQAGDEVLAAVGRRLRETMRSSDIKCRYGGEEFLVVLPETSLEGARHVADMMRRAIGKHPVVWGESPIDVAASFGLTVAAEGERDATAVIARADAALYQAKHDGRNCVREQLPVPSDTPT